jgi:branched-chain amino acid transport system substrate-binding protein
MGVIWGLLLAFLSIAFSQDVIRFGAAISLTGKFAKEGQLVKQGYDLWKERVNASGGIKVGNNGIKWI